MVWAFLRTLLDPKVQQKIFIFSNTGYQDELLRYVHPDNLPVQYGGRDETLDFITERGPWVDDDWRKNFV